MDYQNLYYSQTILYTFIFSLANDLGTQMTIMGRCLYLYLLLIWLLANPITASQVPPQSYRWLSQGKEGLSPKMEGIVNFSMELLSTVINLLKRVLVLTTLLFLIENLINFWVLASSYAFLAVQMPQYFKTSISNIYALYNQSLLSYIGITIQYPNLTVQNQLYANLPNPDLYKFNFIQFALEPCILLALTLIELSFFKWVLKKIKCKAKRQRDEYLKNAIEAKTQNKKTKLEKQSQNQKCKLVPIPGQGFLGESYLGNILRSNKVANEGEASRKKDRKQQNIIMEITYKLLEQNMRKQLNNAGSKHWSQDISINKMEKVAALIINYMTGLLLPSFSLFFQNKLNNLWEKINMMVYYLLLGLILLFPFLYISRNHKKSRKTLLKSSQIETLSQYFVNMCMSVTLGIRMSPAPFLVITFLVISILLVMSLSEGKPGLSCESITFKKVNNIIHKLTFWLYNFTFLAMYFIVLVKNKQQDQLLASNLDEYAYYCSLLCVGLFVLGGCHQLVEFAIKTIATVFKLIYMLYEASSQPAYDKEQQHSSLADVEVAREVRANSQPLVSEPLRNQADNMFANMREEMNYEQELEIAGVIERQIIVHEVLLQHLREQQYL